MTRFARLFVWLGGTLFVVSLVFCVWWYVVVLGRQTPGPTPTSVIWDALLFSMFAAHHSVFAREGVKRLVGRVVSDELVRSVYVWTASLLLIVVCFTWRPIGGEVYDVRGVRRILMVALQLAGIALIARATATIDPLELAGIRRHASSSGPLQVGGPYRLVRHPLYLGWVMATLATPHLTADRLGFALITAAYLFAAVPLEERSLVRSFGKDYERYQQRVRWRIIPFIY